MSLCRLERKEKPPCSVTRLAMQGQEKHTQIESIMQRRPDRSYLPVNDHICACPVSGEISTGWGLGSGFALISWKQVRLLGGEEDNLDDKADGDDASGTSESFSAEAEAKRQDQSQLQIFAPATKAGLSGIREPHHLFATSRLASQPRARWLRCHLAPRAIFQPRGLRCSQSLRS